MYDEKVIKLFPVLNNIELLLTYWEKNQLFSTLTKIFTRLLLKKLIGLCLSFQIISKYYYFDKKKNDKNWLFRLALGVCSYVRRWHKLAAIPLTWDESVGKEYWATARTWVAFMKWYFHHNVTLSFIRSESKKWGPKLCLQILFHIFINLILQILTQSDIFLIIDNRRFFCR